MDYINISEPFFQQPSALCFNPYDNILAFSWFFATPRCRLANTVMQSRPTASECGEESGSGFRPIGAIAHSAGVEPNQCIANGTASIRRSIKRKNAESFRTRKEPNAASSPFTVSPHATKSRRYTTRVIGAGLTRPFPVQRVTSTNLGP
jgi:hypothetical protein